MYHLVDGAIAIRGQEALAEDERQLEERVRLLIEAEVLPVGRFAQHLPRGVVVLRSHSGKKG